MNAATGCVPVVVWRPCRDCDGRGCATCAGLGQWPDPQELDLAALTARQRRYLGGPLILHPGGECDPEWLRAAVVAGRLAQLWQERAGVAPAGQASLEEVLAYLHSASLVQPLASDEVGLFEWAFLQVLPRYGRGCPRELAGMLGCAVPVAAPHSLDGLRCGLRSAVERRACRRRVV